MIIYVDADGCPVIRQVEETARKYQIPVVLLCDTNHRLESNTSEVIIVEQGADAVDFALINRCKKGDLVVTQDYGVAAMALGKGAFGIHQSGMWYTEENIEKLLMERHLAKKARMASNKNSNKHHLKGPKKRSKEQDAYFTQSLERLLNERLLSAYPNL